MRRRGLEGRLGIVLWIGGCLLIGYAGGAATELSRVDWYSQLRRPPLNPPDAVFAPVWTVLYVLIGVVGWRLWRLPAGPGKALRALFAAQLVLNALWSPLFFGLRSPAAGLVDILTLWSCLFALTKLGWTRDRLSSALLLPYLAWVSFASYLNACIWYLN